MELDRKRAAHDFFTNKYELEYFPPESGGKAPFVLICPGGAYQNVWSSIEGEPIARAFIRIGFAAFVLRYRTRKKGRYPHPQEDIARAIREILEREDIVKENYAVCGFSAGGYVAASFGTESMGYAKYDLPKPGVMILCYPVITMDKDTHETSRKNLLGKDPTKELVELCSVEKQVTAGYPPTFIWNSLEDKEVKPSNSAMMAQALDRAGIPHEFVCYRTGDHGIGLGTGTECEDWLERCVAFWRAAEMQ